MTTFLYNTATAIMAIAVVLMMVFVVIEFRQAGMPNQSANFPGHDYEGRLSAGIPATGKGIPQKDLK